MKFKYLILSINLLLCITLGYCFYQIRNLEYHSTDLSTINDHFKSVEEGLNQGEEPTLLMKEYNCIILMKASDDYTSKLYQCIDNGDILIDYIKNDILLGKIVFLRNQDSFQKMKTELGKIIILIVIVTLCAFDLSLLLIYLRLIKPFRQLQSFASNIAIGELDLPLYMQKDNYFGAFTESFDLMREELKKAKEGEVKANRSKKELVASLSHDIKTPVSTIKALCEILEIKLQEDENLGKIRTIHQKADLIDTLISNMFHATLAELQALKVAPSEEPSTILSEMLFVLQQFYPIQIMNPIPSCLICCDKLRLAQVIDNIISNSYKYAGTDIHVTYHETKTHLLITIRDFGTAVDDIDLALVCEKFYRGSNTEGKAGSGLGLFLAKQFTEGMGGSLVCEKDNGFITILSLKKAG